MERDGSWPGRTVIDFGERARQPQTRTQYGRWNSARTGGTFQPLDQIWLCVSGRYCQALRTVVGTSLLLQTPAASMATKESVLAHQYLHRSPFANGMDTDQRFWTSAGARTTSCYRHPWTKRSDYGTYLGRSVSAHSSTTTLYHQYHFTRKTIVSSWPDRWIRNYDYGAFQIKALLSLHKLRR